MKPIKVKSILNLKHWSNRYCTYCNTNRFETYISH